jgi:MOSC domain-containing protein YiiM
MKLLNIQVGKPIVVGDTADRPWTTGFYKAAVVGPVSVGHTNLAGDGQADLTNHGGPDKAICVYPQDHGDYWQAELGLPLPPGAFGENFTTQGMVEADVCIGDIFTCGTTTLQVSQPRQPCWKLARRWQIKDLAARVEKTGRTGWYFRVLSEGTVQAPADLVLIQRPYPQWTITAANTAMRLRAKDAQAARALASCPALSAGWQATLVRPVTTSQAAGPPTA